MPARTMPAIALTLALAAACDDNPVAPADRPPPAAVEGLSIEESAALFRGIIRLSFADADALHPGSALIECPQGGQVELTEVIEEFQADGDRPEMDVAFTIVPTSCRIRSQGNSQFVVDGNPSLRTEMHIEAGRLGFQEVVYITGTITGDLGWQLHARSGNCSIYGTLDAWASVVPDPDSQGSSYFTGSVCGHEVKIDTSNLLQPPPFPA